MKTIVDFFYFQALNNISTTQFFKRYILQMFLSRYISPDTAPRLATDTIVKCKHTIQHPWVPSASAALVWFELVLLTYNTYKMKDHFHERPLDM